MFKCRSFCHFWLLRVAPVEPLSCRFFFFFFSRYYIKSSTNRPPSSHLSIPNAIIYFNKCQLNFCNPSNNEIDDLLLWKGWKCIMFIVHSVFYSTNRRRNKFTHPISYLLGRQSSERGRDEVTYFSFGDLFCIHLGTKYANFRQKMFAEISGKNASTFHCCNVTMKSLELFFRNLLKDFFLENWHT